MPHDLVERIIASCHVIGDLVGGTCWRKGACFKGNNAGQRAGGEFYALMVDFREATGSENIPTAGTLTLRTFGARDGRAVWEAMRFAISTVFRLFGEFPGLNWYAWLECPADEGVKSHNLPGPRDQQVGRPVLDILFDVHQRARSALQPELAVCIINSDQSQADMVLANEDAMYAPGATLGQQLLRTLVLDLTTRSRH